MAIYKFEVNLTLSELIEVEADSYDEAMDKATEEADAFYAVAPEGWSIPWDYVDLNDYEIPEEG